ncbi:hypothetical protein ACFQPG_08900 [Sphingomonas sp. GCM10030256]|uniref:hypothetical protein n=1 Tax=Sphingomonas sp. GCM10030256 TaxID=3273427 RepID=UPI00361DD330
MSLEPEPTGAEDRREFLQKCGKFAVLTPPAVTFLLSTTMSSKAIAASTARSRGGNGSGAGALAVGAGGIAAIGAAATDRRPALVEPAQAPAPVAQPVAPLAPAPVAAPPPPPSYISAGERG